MYDGNELPKFRIEVKMRNWKKPGIILIRNLRIIFNSHVIQLFQNHFNKVDQRQVTREPMYDETFIIRRQGKFTSLTTNFGLHILWTGNAWIDVQVPTTYEGKLKGILGNFDGVAENDLMKADGTRGSACEVGESWKVTRDRCKSGCHQNQQQQKQTTNMKQKKHLKKK